tara:strand:- start:2716 stop:3306 length:591 start_codon:yes stop_codon:yes gene_type:complete
MTNLMETFEKNQIEKLISKKRIPAFRAGDTLKVTVKISEGDKSRLQAFEGVCIARKNNSVNSNFTVRKMSHGEGVERVFPLFSPIINKIEVIRKGNVKRSKLYYLRDRTGKNARIADKDRGIEIDQYELEDIPQDNSENLSKESSVKDEVSEKNLEKPNENQAEASVEKQADIKTEEKKSESTVSEAENTDNESKS